MLRSVSLLASLVVIAVALPACDDKKPAPPATTAPAATPATSAAGAKAEEPKKPAAKVSLRQLIWTEKTPAETKYVDCMVKACIAVYKECYGDKVEQGEVSGPCGDYGNCVAACATDACKVACLDKHKKEGSACDACGDKVGACSEAGKCSPPVAMPH